ncbi:MAG TPA: sugar ABC transporter substrate-binding protein [Clostridiaceae bacterium]|nr:sugar ABC transporter substrate-binding protein [Clostridiaceae bacterium]
MRKIIKVLSLVLCLMILTSLFTACTESSSGTAKTSTSDKPLSGKKIGVSLYYKGDEWYVNMDKEFKEQGAALGAEMIIQDANASPETQQAQLENFVTQQCDMIMFCAVDPEGIGTTLDSIAGKNIPIVGFDEPPVWDDLVSFVAWDNYKTGVEMGKYVRKYIDEKKGGKANIVIFNLAQSPLCMSRAEGFKEGLGDMGSNIKIIAEQDPENNEEKASNMITNIKEPFDIVFTVTDPGAFGAVAALEAMGASKDIKVFSCGGYGEKTYNLLKDQNPYYEAVVVIPPAELVKSLMDIAVKYFEGKASEIPKRVDCNFEIADKNNYKSLEP